MRKIGLVGGVGWRSTVAYYRLINEEVERRLGGLHSAPLALRETQADRERFVQVIDGLARAGAQAVVLGCTELPLLLANHETTVPCLDTTQLHAAALVDAALNTD